MRVLLLYITSLSGHYKAAKAIEKALKIKDKDFQIISLDILSYLHPFSSRFINLLYSFIIKKIPFLWGSIYDKENFIKGINPLKELVHIWNFKKVKKLVSKFRPQAIVCTQAFPCGLMAFLKEKENLDLPLIGVITDFWPNRFWFDPKVNYYVTAFDWARERFKRLSIPEDRVKILGLPIMPEFKENLDKRSLFSKFDLSPDLPAVLIMGGGLGIGPLEKISFLLDNSKETFQIIVICGKNKRLYHKLFKRKFKKTTRIFSYTQEVSQIMSLSDIIITKPGGITIAESLAKGLAIIVLKPIPGQETNNLKFLLEKKLVFKADKSEEALSLVEALLYNKDRLKAIQERSRSFGRPEASLEIAELILKTIKDGQSHSL